MGSRNRKISRYYRMINASKRMFGSIDEEDTKTKMDHGHSEMNQRFSLAMMILFYVFINNDGILSMKERAGINKLAKKARPYLSLEDIQSIYQYQSKNMTSDDIKAFMSQKHIERAIFDQAIYHLRSTIKISTKNQFYIQQLRDILGYQL